MRTRNNVQKHRAKSHPSVEHVALKTNAFAELLPVCIEAGSVHNPDATI
jgi:hypothetical protein